MLWFESWQIWFDFNGICVKSHANFIKVSINIKKKQMQTSNTPRTWRFIEIDRVKKKYQSLNYSFPD